MIPKAPDADIHDLRTIEMYYDAPIQAIVAYKTVETGERILKERILVLPDGHPFHQEVETLKAWGVVCETKSDAAAITFRKYWIHNTPRVRAIIEKMMTQPVTITEDEQHLTLVIQTSKKTKIVIRD